MQNSDQPIKIDIPWAAHAGPSYIREVPDTSQQPTFPYAASWPIGFPPDTFLPNAAGGSGPDGRDMNGVLNQMSAWLQWNAAGGALVTYDSVLQATIGGYPNGAVIGSATTAWFYWRSTADNNTTNPDTGGAGWVPFFPSARQQLLADTTFYVSPSGSNSNAGTSGAPWATLQHAWDIVSSSYDLGGHRVTINCADGSYSQGASCTGAPVGQTSPIIFNGNTMSPSNCVVSMATGNCFAASNGANIQVQGFTTQVSGGGGSCLVALYGGIINQQFNVFAACFTTVNHMSVSTGGVISINSNYSVTGGGGAHIANTGGSIVLPAAMTVTGTGTITWASAFIIASGSGSMSGLTGMNFSGGTYTGVRYSITLNAVVNTNGAGASYLPGNVAGTTASGGQYA